MSAALQRRVIMSALTALVLLVAATPLRAQHLLVPMDDAQSNHLKAYGLTFGALTDGVRSEWLLNFRGGSFLLPDLPGLRRAALLAGVTAEAIDDARLVDIRRQIADGNMDAVPLDKAPRIAVYSPPQSMPWDDAVTLALTMLGAARGFVHAAAETVRWMLLIGIGFGATWLAFNWPG